MNECLTRIGNLEKSVSKLETVIDERFQRFEENLKRMETTLTAKLDKIDEDIRGNGKKRHERPFRSLGEFQETSEPLFLDYYQRDGSHFHWCLSFVGGNFVPMKSQRTMEDIQRRVDLAFAELDVIEEMLRPLVAAKTIYESEEGFPIPVKARTPAQLPEEADCFLDRSGGISALLHRVHYADGGHQNPRLLQTIEDGGENKLADQRLLDMFLLFSMIRLFDF